MNRYGWVAIGGALGSMGRYAISSWVQRLTAGSFPFGTLAVNVTGCLAIGVLARVLDGRVPLAPEARLLLITGLLGGFTTFSAFGYETFALWQSGRPALAGVNAVASVAVGLAAVVAGQAGARAMGW